MIASAADPIVCLVGPTAVGKTSVAIRLASQMGAEIISMDSRLLYRGMDIGTAKPNQEERNLVTHHLVDVADPGETWSLARYLQACMEVVEKLHTAGVLPLLVGGTGQYYRSLVEGWVPPTTRISEAFRNKMEAYAREHGQQALHDQLRRVDPDSAESIDGRNVRRVIRALEILHLTGIPASVQKKRETPVFPILSIGLWLPREVLYDRIDRRIDDMLAQGWLEEVQGLLHAGYTPDQPSFSAIGYRELAAHVEGKLSLEEAVQRIRRGSRQFVRRQANWFKMTDERIHWFENTPGVVRRIRAEVEKRVSTAS